MTPSPEEIFQHLRLSDMNKVMERLRKMSKVAECFPHSETAFLLRNFAKFFEACKRDQAPT